MVLEVLGAEVAPVLAFLNYLLKSYENIPLHQGQILQKHDQRTV